MITVRQILDAAWHRETALSMHWVDALNAACRLPGVTQIAAIQARRAVATARARLAQRGDTQTSPLEEAYYACPTLRKVRIPLDTPPTTTFPPKANLIPPP